VDTPTGPGGRRYDRYPRIRRRCFQGRERPFSLDQIHSKLAIIRKEKMALLQKCYSGGYLPVLCFRGWGGPDWGLVRRPN
jgi:hypothetical protein